MKLIIQNARIAGTATEEYTGPDAFIPAPDDFDSTRMGEYVVTEGVASIPLPGVPQSVTMRQARLALLAAGKLAAVNSAIAGMTGAAGDAARIEWEFSGIVSRNQPLVVALGEMLGLTAVQLDDLFTEAAAL